MAEDCNNFIGIPKYCAYFRKKWLDQCEFEELEIQEKGEEGKHVRFWNGGWMSEM